MRLTVFRHKVWDHQMMIRLKYPLIEGASVIEDAYLEVDESDLAVYGRIAVN